MLKNSITSALFAALDIVIMERLEDCSFTVLGTIPDWFISFYPDIKSKSSGLKLEEKFPFLENFVIDAESFWIESSAENLSSGLWIETDKLGKEYCLKASAVKLQNNKILMLSLVDTDYQEKQQLIQKGRESSLNHYNLLKEIQKKEILFHCIAHDIAGELTAINYCFQLLGLENLTAKGREYLEIGKKQTAKQEMLIREVLNAFSAEVDSSGKFVLDPAQFPDALSCAKEVVDALLPTFLLNQINLQLELHGDSSEDWRVAGEKLRLERIFNNLIENAFRYSPPDSTVTLGLKSEENFVLITIDDEGIGVSEEAAKTLFQKFSQGRGKAGKAGLGLYFCRITVERWGGSIGYSTRETGGSRFWLRLPKPFSQ